MDQQKLKEFMNKLLAVDVKSLNEQQLAEHMNLVSKAQKLAEVSLGDYRKKATMQKAQAGMGAMFGGDPEKRAKDLATFKKRERGLERVKARDEATRKAEQERQLADLVARLPELKAEYAEMQKQYKALGGSNWQYADREQNLTDYERKARSMEGPMNNLWRQIQAAEKAQKQQGVAEGSFDHYSPMAKDSVKADKIRSLKNLIAITDDKIEAIVKDGGRVGLNDPLSLRLKELRAELKKIQSVAEGYLDNPGQEDSPVAQAIIRRILMQRSDLLAKYGPEKVGQAVDEVADWVGDVDEIGSSDVSGWIKQVEQALGIANEAQERLTKVFDFKDYKG